MRYLSPHAVLVSGTIICVLALTVGAAAAHEISGTVEPAVLRFADTGVPSNNTTITNAMTVSSQAISLSNSLDAQGTATIDQQPLANARVALHMGDVVVATTQTNATGAYAFSAPIGVYYFPAAISGEAATVYSVVTPPDGTVNAPSGVTSVAVDALPFYILLVVIVGAVLVGLYVYVRRRRGEAEQPESAQPTLPAQEPASTEDAASTPAPEPASGPDELHKYGVAAPLDRLTQPVASPEHTESAEVESPPSEPAVTSEERADAEALPSDVVPEPPEHAQDSPEADVAAGHGVLVHAHNLFEQGHDCEAANALYDVVISALADAGDVTLAPYMTLREKCAALRAVMPEVEAPLRQLTLACELRKYGRTPVTKERQDAALEAFRSIMERVDERARVQAHEPEHLLS